MRLPNYGRGLGVGRSLGVGAILGVGVTRGVGVTVGVGVGVAPDCAQYLPPVLGKMPLSMLYPPQTTI
jgi:hypothetical protein